MDYLEIDSKKISLSEFNNIIKIFKMYYHEKRPQKDIAAELKASQSEISRIIKTALEDNIVRLEVIPNVDMDVSPIKQNFPHLEDIIVSFAPDTKDYSDDYRLISYLGYEGAKYFLSTVDHANTVGFTCGRTLNALVNSLEKARNENYSLRFPEKCKIYSLVHPCMNDIVDITTASIVASTVRLLPKSEGYAYHFPEINLGKGEEFKKYIMDNTKIGTVMKKMENLDIYFTGIGYIDFEGTFRSKPVGLHFNSLVSSLDLNETLKDCGAVGEANQQPFDKDGNFLIDKEGLERLFESFIYLPLTTLKEQREKGKKVVAIAGGGLKHQAIYAALKAKFFNVLITDYLTMIKIKEFIKIDKEKMKHPQERFGTVLG